jgi:hypothetical protein
MSDSDIRFSFDGTSAKQFARLLQGAVRFSAGDDPARPALQKVELGSDANSIYLTAADGHVMLRAKIACAGIPFERIHLLHTTVTSIAKHLLSHPYRSSEPATISITRIGIVHGKGSRFRITTVANGMTQTTEAEYFEGTPNYDALIRDEARECSPTVVNAGFIRNTARVWEELETPMIMASGPPTEPIWIHGTASIGDYPITLCALVMPMHNEKGTTSREDLSASMKETNIAIKLGDAVLKLS